MINWVVILVWFLIIVHINRNYLLPLINVWNIKLVLLNEGLFLKWNFYTHTNVFKPYTLQKWERRIRLIKFKSHSNPF